MGRPARRCAPIKSARVARDADAEATVRALRGQYVSVCFRMLPVKACVRMYPQYYQILHRKASVRQRAEVHEFSTVALKGCSPRSLPLVVRTAL
jgi:hypothetical protein